MHRCSDSIAALAAALAKAQIELTNPQKSLIGSIKVEDGGAAERLFRYASLASGLDIVRKTLGQHAIAVVQTTAIDQAAGVVNLTTVLAHASGQWIASDWPVCALADWDEPHRAGMALTYARRYGLFTLVGIAGEDDLDAPDLVTPTALASGHQLGANGQSKAGAQAYSSRRPAARRNVRDGSNRSSPTLAPDASAQLRDRMLGEIDNLGDGDTAALWAKRSLAEKNKLIASDARRVEDAFQAALANLVVPDMPKNGEKPELSPAHAHPRRLRKKPRQRSKTIDKSVLAFPEPRRIRDRDHVRFVAKQPCLVCGRQPSDAHHVRFAQSRALGRKVSDEFTVPLCRGHHREVHHCGDEPVWWLKVRVNPMVKARALWRKTHPLPASVADSRIAATTPVAPTGSGQSKTRAMVR